MDNLTHTLVGVALARSRVLCETPLAATAFIVGANAPDIDLAWSTHNDLAYYALHRGFTHSLLGAGLVAIGLWALLLAFGRLRSLAPTPWVLLAASTLGVASHVVLDAANAYGIRPFLPWSGRWFYGDLFTIADPWIWLLLGGVFYVTARRRWWINAASAIATALVLAAMAALPVVPRPALALWIAGLAGIIVYTKRRRPEGDATTQLWRRALALLLAYAVACLAARGVIAARLDPPGASALLPRLADPLSWSALWVDPTTVRGRTLGVRARLDRPEDDFERTGAPLDDPAVAAVLASCAGEVVREFFRFPLVSVAPLPDGATGVTIQDVRFARDGSGGFGVFATSVDPAGQVGIDPSACP